MAAILIQDKVSKEDIKIAGEEYGEYIKIVVDTKTGEVAIGGEWHADGEKMLLEKGSKQEDLWGGGIDLKTGQIDFNSLINTRPGFNNSQEILDQDLRRKFEELVKDKFNL